jgi:hypothetical protein
MSEKLSNKQIRALRIMRDNSGIADTFNISGATGGSLVKRGLCFRHWTGGDDYGTNITYEITRAGLDVLQSIESSD